MFFFSKFKIHFHTFVIRQTQLFQMMVSDEVLKQCDTEAFVKFDNCELTPRAAPNKSFLLIPFFMGHSVFDTKLDSCL